jgi:hypothetical protein
VSVTGVSGDCEVAVLTVPAPVAAVSPLTAPLPDVTVVVPEVPLPLPDVTVVVPELPLPLPDVTVVVPELPLTGEAVPAPVAGVCAGLVVGGWLPAWCESVPAGGEW